MAQKKKLNKAFGKIIWALDALPDDPRLQGKVAEVLQALQKSGDSHITPAYIFSDRLLSLEGKLNERQLNSYRSTIEKAITTLISTFNLKELQDPAVISLHGGSTKTAVKKLVQYAKKSKAGMIVIGSHARQGMNRFMMGSFAETLIHHSKVPVLIVNPKTKTPTTIKKIFFPTDFSAASKKAFKSTLKLAQACEAEVTLFHQISPPSRLMVEMGAFSAFGLGYSLTEHTDKEKKKREQHAADWIRIAKESQIKIQAIIQNDALSPSDSVVKAAQELDVDLIAMASQSGPVSAVILGSVSRNVIRNAGCPVWVLHA